MSDSFEPWLPARFLLMKSLRGFKRMNTLKIFFKKLAISACWFLCGISPSWGQVETLTELETWLTPDEHASGWIALFDGKTLFGWQAESEVDWKVGGETISATTGERGLLRTTTQFDRFELFLEFTAGPETNSGVFIMTSPRPTDPAIDCYEVNIVAPDRHEFATGALVARAKSEHAPELKYGEWHSMRIVADGENLSVEIDGILACRYRDTRPLGRGYIGLQYNGGPVGFRNIKLKPSSLTPLHPNTDFDATWNTQQLLDSKAAVTPAGLLRLIGGRGQLESRDRFADFVFSARAKSPAGVNSGVFFRCIPGEVMNGYECQIEHGVDENGKPTDCGTGGIFRRQDARIVLTRPDEWFDLTIVANGPHIATWVNGLQVADWRDIRDPDPNPRRGKRLENGTICIQGHDPETIIEFEKISIREIDKRNR
jgi:hypothetical protein